MNTIYFNFETACVGFENLAPRSEDAWKYHEGNKWLKLTKIFGFNV